MDEDETLEDQLDSDGDDDAADSGSDNSAPPTPAQKPKGNSERVNDLMSMFNREQARANAAEAKLAALEGGNAQSDGTQGDNGSAEVDEFKEFARENARLTLFNSDPRLAEAGLTVEDIAGTTLTEMRASAKKHLKVVDGIEGRLRNKILAEHGLDPEVATGQGTEKAPSFSTMTDKEFNDYLEQRDSRPR